MAWRAWKGAAAKLMMKDATREGVRKTLHVIAEQARDEVPLDEGTLKRSIDVFMAKSGDAAGSVSAGGGRGTGRFRVPYAIRHHETDANFQRGRKRNYLRDPFNKLARPTLEAAIKDEINKRFK